LGLLFFFCKGVIALAAVVGVVVSGGKREAIPFVESESENVAGT